jgi:hypothetical protein
MRRKYTIEQCFVISILNRHRYRNRYRNRKPAKKRLYRGLFPAHSGSALIEYLKMLVFVNISMRPAGQVSEADYLIAGDNYMVKKW